MHAGNTTRPWEKNDEQGMWEPTAACGNVELHGWGPNTEKRHVCKDLVVGPEV
jgi:hypothetical protein